MRRNFVTHAFTVFLFLSMTVYGENEVVADDDSDTRQIYVELKYVRIPEKEIAEIASKLKVSPNPRVIDSSFIPFILKSANLEVIAGAGAISCNNQETTLRISDEKYFPNAYEYYNLSESKEEEEENSVKDISDTDAKVAKKDKPKEKSKNSPYTYLMPVFGEPTEFSLRMVVTPCIESGKINLSITPILTSESEPTVYNIGISKYNMPSFKTSINELISYEISDGGMLIHSSTSTKQIDNDQKLTETRDLLLVTAKIMNPDGTPTTGPVKTADKMKSDESMPISPENDTPLVQVETMFIDVDSKDLPSITGKKELFGLPDKELLPKLLNSGKCRILVAPQTIASSGDEATYRQVEEKYFPTWWCEPSLNITDGKPGIIAPYPEFDDSSDIGTRLGFSVSVFPEQKTINLNLNYQTINLVGWSEYYCEIFEFAGISEKSIHKYPMKMPILESLEQTTNVTVASGEAIPIAKMQMNRGSCFDDSEEKSSRIVFVFLTATIMGPDGKVLREGRECAVPGK